MHVLYTGEILNKSTSVAANRRQPDSEVLPRGDADASRFQAPSGWPQLPLGGAADPLQLQV